MTYYVYMVHEAPIEPPYYCKVGYTDAPLKRLNELQARNPRPLRSWDVSRRPTQPFGFELPDKSHARAFELRVHERLEGMGLRTRRDLNYETHQAPVREWLAELHPEKLWHLMAVMYFDYIKEFGLLDTPTKLSDQESRTAAGPLGSAAYDAPRST
jgi:hypothetical protein